MHYLSDKWLEAADAALRSASDDAPGPGLVIDQHIEGLRSYRVVIGPGESSVADLQSLPNDRVGAAATFTQSAETARAVACGDTDAHQAFLLGHIRFEGDVNVLIERRPAFDWLSATLAPVMSNTTFES